MKLSNKLSKMLENIRKDVLSPNGFPKNNSLESGFEKDTNEKPLICTFCEKPMDRNWWQKYRKGSSYQIVRQDMHPECLWLSQHLERWGVPCIFCKDTQFIVDTGNSYAINAITEFIKDSKKKGIYLYGPPGVGKTALAVKIILETNFFLDKQMVPETELFSSLKASFGDKYGAAEQIINELKVKDLLVIDDIGTSKPSEWVDAIIYEILNYRWSNEKKTLFTSNLSPDDLAMKIGGRSASRICGMCDVIEIKGVDHRLIKDPP